ncbi:hypothetical protein Zmor_013464 [Zophobas morio]|uniref:Uncharacterized protein n=1 Tax=Zophobas morio TaxID=2755281 RepID=A0AA38IHB3_9CUCU|nr:hypothetical protein Zmor_013464 [Zophobas morio]
MNYDRFAKQTTNCAEIATSSPSLLKSAPMKAPMRKEPYEIRYSIIFQFKFECVEPSSGQDDDGEERKLDTSFANLCEGTLWRGHSRLRTGWYANHGKARMWEADLKKVNEYLYGAYTIRWQQDNLMNAYES